MIHIHKYRRVLLGGRKVVIADDGTRTLIKSGGSLVWRCILPNCSHYIQDQLAFGRTSICWKCGAQMTLNPENMRRVKPTHRECRREN